MHDVAEGPPSALRRTGRARGGHHLLPDIAAARGREPAELLREILQSTNSFHEAAEALGVSDPTIARWVRRYGIEVSWA
jgi:hypothetical protein